MLIYLFRIESQQSRCLLVCLILATDSVPSCKDRVYPELQRLLGQHDCRVVVGRDAQWELILARAACIRDICTER